MPRCTRRSTTASTRTDWWPAGSRWAGPRAGSSRRTTLRCGAPRHPGAGFAETPEFLNVFQKEKVEPTWYEKKLWHLYNATDYAQNLFNLPTVAYSGEIDRQKQAADVMAREMKKVGLELTHIIGPKTGHSYEKDAKEEVNKRIDAIVEKGQPKLPKEVKFTTYTLRYNQCGVGHRRRAWRSTGSRHESRAKSRIARAVRED